ncbi:MAG: hypothetical protein ABEL76_13220 [Bradymonadaceae bacterium]
MSIAGVLLCAGAGRLHAQQAGAGEKSAATGDEAGGAADPAASKAGSDTTATSQGKKGESMAAGEDSSAYSTSSSTSGGSTSGSSTSGASGSDQAKVGPSGRKLRTDYPGTKASKKKQMKTDRIEGLDFNEGNNPAEAYKAQIQELQTKIDDLKEDVFQSKSRVVLLKQTVLGQNLTGSRARIIHDDDLGATFKLQRAMYSLDGSRVYNESDATGSLAKKKEIEVYNGDITTGGHNVSILLEYQGGGFGIFNYMQAYKVRIRSSCQFEAKAGKETILRVHAYNKGGAFANVENEPGIRCEIKSRELSASENLASTTSSGNSSSGSGGK